MSSWCALERELDLWAEAGRAADVWWRDDDAVAPSDALARLFALAARVQAPLGLAVIPAEATRALPRHCDALATPLQHGYAHRNHAGPDEKKCELSDRRERQQVRDELTRGAAIMAELLGARALPVLVPPWNRIGPRTAAGLAALGFRGLSCYGPRTAAVPGLCQVNTHLDILRWRPSRGFLGEAEALGQLLGLLEDRRRSGDGEPVGLLTHHLVHDAAAWQFCERLLELLARHRGARLRKPAELFAVTGPD